MAKILKVGDTIMSQKGVTIKVTKLISAKGGQGYVYAVDYGGTSKVLKWYKAGFLDNLRAKRLVEGDNGETRTVRAEASGKVDPAKLFPGERVAGAAIDAFYNNLVTNSRHAPPSKVYVWPQDVTVWLGGAEDSFGYIMDFIDMSTYVELTDYFLFRKRYADRGVMLTACLNIVDAFEKLHVNGYSYQDLNNGNIFVKADTGEVLIADNDNITPNRKNLGVAGKDRYMAPEIVDPSRVGKKVVLPDRKTDAFSLAIILFRMMMGGQHPLEGVYSENNDEKTVYGSDPVFIFDPTDKRNAPVPEKHKNVMVMWPQYPEYIHKMFLAFFGKQALSNPQSRPVEAILIDTLVRLRGEMVDCPKCKEAPVFLNTQGAVQCPKCKTPLTVPCKIKFPGAIIPIVPGITVYKCQFDRTCKEFNAPAFKFIMSKDRTKMGFGNMMKDTTWVVTYPDGTRRDVPYGQVADFKVGMKIAIGPLVGEVLK